MIVIIVCLFVFVVAGHFAGAYFRYLAAIFGLTIELIKLAWRLSSWVYNKLRGRRRGSPPRVIPGARAEPEIGSADVRPLKDDRPVNSRISNHHKK